MISALSELMSLIFWGSAIATVVNEIYLMYCDEGNVCNTLTLCDVSEVKGLRMFAKEKGWEIKKFERWKMGGGRWKGKVFKVVGVMGDDESCVKSKRKWK